MFSLLLPFLSSADSVVGSTWSYALGMPPPGTLRAFARTGPAAPPARPIEALTGREDEILMALLGARTASRSPSGPTTNRVRS
ncbi:hypothetical protein ACWGH8_38835 [Nonomuraea muscovyensis]